MIHLTGYEHPTFDATNESKVAAPVAFLENSTTKAAKKYGSPKYRNKVN